MADSTTDFSKMKVVELRKELKSRGLSYSGDKSELVARLQATVREESNGDINLDSDEIDSDAVLDDEDEKTHTELFDETVNEELALADPPSTQETTQPKPQRTLKRKLINLKMDAEKSENKEPKKITLNRSTSLTTSADHNSDDNADKKQEEPNKVTSISEVDTKSKLEMRAKRFGLPVKMTESERKEARKIRFGQTSNSLGNTPSAVSENMEKLRKRAERFGQSVSKIMTDLENRERIEKRKQKFGSIK